jgi:hypothetical protein
MKLFILGARQKARWVWPVEAEERFDQALILRLVTETKLTTRVVKYETPIDAKAHRASSNVFASGTLCGNRLYICTYTEVIVFELPNFRQVAYLSLPRFNALHHVRPTARGTVLVVNTGLDEVVEVTLNGVVVREWGVLGESTWTRFSPDVDYRKVASTKPHLSHPNYVFEISNDVWVTRFHQRDAVCLTRPSQSIKIALERPHDGVLSDGRIYFTTVNGHLVVADATSFEIVSTSDLRSFAGYPFGGRAWCRGLMVINSRTVCVGFTRIRKTALMRTGIWIKHGFHDADTPTHVATFDLVEERCLNAINLEKHGMNLLFGVLDAEGFPESENCYDE